MYQGRNSGSRGHSYSPIRPIPRDTPTRCRRELLPSELWPRLSSSSLTDRIVQIRLRNRLLRPAEPQLRCVLHSALKELIEMFRD